MHAVRGILLGAALTILVAAQDDSTGPRAVKIGEVVEGEVRADSPIVHTPTLDENCTDAPVRGLRFRAELPAGTTTIELRSFLFDAYLVVRDAKGAIVAEDDDGLLRTHARVVLAPEGSTTLEIVACALHGGSGRFELALRAGAAKALSPVERSAAEIEDARRALEIRTRERGPEHDDTVAGLNDLAFLLEAAGRYEEARPLLERALAIEEKLHGMEHPDTATSLNSLACLLEREQRFDDARPLVERALAIHERTLRLDELAMAKDLNTLATLLYEQSRFLEAQPIWERALASCDRARDVADPSRSTEDMAASILGNLAMLLERIGRRDEACEYMRRALAIHEEIRGPESVEVSRRLVELANLLLELGRRDEARPYYERAIAMWDRASASELADMTALMSRLAACLFGGGDRAEADHVAERAVQVLRTVVVPNLGTLTEFDRINWLDQHRWESDLLLSILAHSSRPDAESRMFDEAVAMRGLVGRGLLSSRQQLLASQDASTRSSLEELRDLDRQLESESYRREVPDGTARDGRIATLRARRDDRERELLRRAPPTDSAAGATLTDVASALPPRSALVEVIRRYRNEPPRREDDPETRSRLWSEELVTAFVIRAGAAAPAHVDFGDAAQVRSAIDDFVAALLSGRRNRGVTAISSVEAERARARANRRLEELLWRPLAPALEGVQQVFVSADQFLGRIPWAAIEDEDGKYLIERMSFVELPDPRTLVDVVRSPMPSTSRAGVLLAMGGVDYGLPGSLVAATSWPPLTNTRTEAPAVVALPERVPKVEGSGTASETLLAGRAATKAALSSALPGARYVHLATHGFFFPEGTPSMWEGASLTSDRAQMSAEMRRVARTLPGLLCGLVCAGANESSKDRDDDGILTAEEITWLDLSKCDLVVLSACETGIGEQRGGEEMASLRSAFRLAGARTVVASLWSVDDASTVELMRSFYRHHWLEGVGKADALHEAQLESIERNRAAHEGRAAPEQWGAFVLSGDWR